MCLRTILHLGTSRGVWATNNSVRATCAYVHICTHIPYVDIRIIIIFTPLHIHRTHMIALAYLHSTHGGRHTRTQRARPLKKWHAEHRRWGCVRPVPISRRASHPCLGAPLPRLCFLFAPKRRKRAKWCALRKKGRAPQTGRALLTFIYTYVITCSMHRYIQIYIYDV